MTHYRPLYWSLIGAQKLGSTHAWRCSKCEPHLGTSPDFSVALHQTFVLMVDLLQIRYVELSSRFGVLFVYYRVHSAVQTRCNLRQYVS
uniref:Uncharacterized protein n=1 Tax=Hyaloperonospora arabidopsidis (strain Emoy2) TaxID=559515 RepID=M4BID9_HYAAE